MDTIYLEFNFLDKQPLSFTSPVAILSTSDIHEIPMLMKEMDEWKKKGYYLAGYLSYEAAPAFHSQYQVHSQPSLPLLWFGVFQNPLSIKKSTKKTYSISNWHPTTTREQFIKDIETIQKKIDNGTVKQVNYTTRFHATFNGDAYTYYQQLLQNQSASYRAFLRLNKTTTILSLSPEMFFHINGPMITTKPMKGTMKRGYTYEEDMRLKNSLYHSVKNRYENEMVAELLKQELSTISKDNTAQITKQFEIETHPTIHQMTSTVTAEMNKDSSIFDWFQALFPCASITGDPKVETTEIIKQLETSARDVYCGAIGYITPNHQAIFNVPIRTILIQDNTAVYGSGSGITSKSEAVEEYEEVVEKTKVLTRETKNHALLESMRLEDGKIPLLSHHLIRLRESAAYFQFPFNENNIYQEIQRFIHSLDTSTSYKVRLVLHQDGQVKLEAQELQPISDIRAVLAPHPIMKDNVYLYHKTTHRSIYEHFDAMLPDRYHTTLLWNEEGNITEFTFGNIVIKKDGQFYTPPISDGLLAGVMRDRLLTEHRLVEKHISKQDLQDAEQIYFINSVRGWLNVQLKEQ